MYDKINPCRILSPVIKLKLERMLRDGELNCLLDFFEFVKEFSCVSEYKIVYSTATKINFTKKIRHGVERQ